MFGPVAQLVAHLHGMQGVRGSNPLRSTTRRSVALGRRFFPLKRRGGTSRSPPRVSGAAHGYLVSMKLLLTSLGLSNPTIVGALEQLLGKPISQSRMVYVPTALHGTPGGGRWAW